MNYIVEEYDYNSAVSLTAKNKARSDILRIMNKNGFVPICVTSQNDRTSENNLNKLFNHLRILKEWKPVLNTVNAGDTVIIQFPVIAHSIFFFFVLAALKMKRVKTIAIIHDLDFLRNHYRSDLTKKYKLRVIFEEVSALRLFDTVVVHNDTMRSFLKTNHYVSQRKMVSLEVFDYLTNDSFKQSDDLAEKKYKDQSVVIAGNLDRTKSEYLYKLPNNTNYTLYGPNYSGDSVGNVHYNGSFEPDLLPSVLTGTFGLVWDGSSADTCEGPFGDYLRINNPHKASLYLASGLPVIIWDKAALAHFIKMNNVGITVSSLDEIPKVFEELSYEKYQEILLNVSAVSEKLRAGYYTNKAVLPFVDLQ